MISESSFNQKNPKEAIKNSAIIHEAFTFESQTANENLSEQFAKCSSLLLGESVISQMDFINNYLIAEAYEAPFPFQPKSLRELQKGISILNAIIQNRIKDAAFKSDMENRYKRLCDELKNAKSKSKCESLERENAKLSANLEISSSQLNTSQSENNTQAEELRRLKAHQQHKEKAYLVELRKKEKDMAKLKDQIYIMLKGTYKQSGLAFVSINPAPKHDFRVTANGFVASSAPSNSIVTSSSNADSSLRNTPMNGSLPSAESVVLWQEMCSRMEERNLKNQIAFEKLKKLLAKVYFSLCTLANDSSGSNDILSPIQLNSFGDSQLEIISEEFIKIFNALKTKLTTPSQFAAPSESYSSLKSTEMHLQDSAIQNLLNEKNAIIDTHKKLLQMSITNESAALEKERNELIALKMALEERQKKLDIDRKSFTDATIKFAQEKQAFFKEKAPIDMQLLP